MPARILIAEDNTVNQRLIGLLFQKAGIEPVMVSDGLQALQAARDEAFDIIFMDLQMPGMDGKTAAEQILAHDSAWPRPVIIAMTAGMDEQLVTEIREAGMSDFLNKPFSFQALQQKLEQWLPVRN